MEMVTIPSSKVEISPHHRSEENSSDTVKPGSKIRPNLRSEDAEKLAERLYGITCKEIKEIISYDDRNYYLDEDRNIKNPLITNIWPHGYVLKVVNTHDSNKLDFVDAQTKMMLFLKERGITCPNPVKNVYGNYFSLENINGCSHVVRLLEYIPGQILHEISPTKNLFYQSGEYVAKLDMLLRGFQHPAYEAHRSIWMLQSIPKLKDFIYAIDDHGRKLIVEQIIESFEKNVLSIEQKLEKGIIHGDFNEQNIIVKKLKDSNDYQICGILDFGDTNLSPVVFELAIAMTYMMLQSKNLSIGGLVIAGYSSVRPIPAIEKRILKDCVAARLCQSLTLGAYTHSMDPGNEYILTTQKAGWEMLELLWKDFDKIDEIWEEEADKYLTQSTK